MSYFSTSNSWLLASSIMPVLLPVKFMITLSFGQMAVPKRHASYATGTFWMNVHQARSTILCISYSLPLAKKQMLLVPLQPAILLHDAMLQLLSENTTEMCEQNTACS